MGITKKDFKDIKYLEQEIKMWREYLIAVKKKKPSKGKNG